MDYHSISPKVRPASPCASCKSSPHLRRRSITAEIDSINERLAMRELASVQKRESSPNLYSDGVVSPKGCRSPVGSSPSRSRRSSFVAEFVPYDDSDADAIRPRQRPISSYVVPPMVEHDLASTESSNRTSTEDSSQARNSSRSISKRERRASAGNLRLEEYLCDASLLYPKEGCRLNGRRAFVLSDEHKYAGCSSRSRESRDNSSTESGESRIGVDLESCSRAIHARADIFRKSSHNMLSMDLSGNMASSPQRTSVSLDTNKIGNSRHDVNDVAQKLVELEQVEAEVFMSVGKSSGGVDTRQVRTQHNCRNTYQTIESRASERRRILNDLRKLRREMLTVNNRSVPASSRCDDDSNFSHSHHDGEEAARQNFAVSRSSIFSVLDQCNLNSQIPNDLDDDDGDAPATAKDSLASEQSTYEDSQFVSLKSSRKNRDGKLFHSSCPDDDKSKTVSMQVSQCGLQDSSLQAKVKKDENVVDAPASLTSSTPADPKSVLTTSDACRVRFPSAKQKIRRERCHLISPFTFLKSTLSAGYSALRGTQRSQRNDDATVEDAVCSQWTRRH